VRERWGVHVRMLGDESVGGATPVSRSGERGLRATERVPWFGYVGFGYVGFGYVGFGYVGFGYVGLARGYRFVGVVACRIWKREEENLHEDCCFSGLDCWRLSM
jgi:hypothetical protein